MPRGIFSSVSTVVYLATPPIRIAPPPFGEAVFGLDLRIVLAHHELHAEIRAALLAGLRQKDDVAVERHVEPLEQQHRHQPAGEVVLVVDRAASVDPAAVARGAERRELPLRLVDGDHVAVAHDQQRLLLAVAFQAGDDVGAVGVEREDLRRDAGLVEHAFEVLGHDVLVAGRVARVEAQHRLELLHHLRLERLPVRPGRLREHARQRQRDDGACSAEARHARRRERDRQPCALSPEPCHFALARLVTTSQLNCTKRCSSLSSSRS